MRWSRRGAGVVLAFVLALAGAEAARAELVARGLDDGMLALTAKGTPLVGYVRGSSLVVSTRIAAGRWRAVKAAAVPAGSRVMAFAAGPKGAVALVQSADDRTLVLVRRRGRGWQRIRLAGGLPADVFLGWPGLALDGAGLPVAAYTRWNGRNHNSQLTLARVDAGGRVHSQRVTRDGFPQSLVPPPAAPVLVGGRVHVVETYGYGLVGTIEWSREGSTWSGLFLDTVRADFPVGPVLARSRTGNVFAAYSMSMLTLDAIPVTLAVRGRSSSTAADFVLDRAVTTALALPASGPEIAANELVAGDRLDLRQQNHVWTAAVVRGNSRVQLDGWMSGYAVSRGGGRDLLLARADGLSWFRSPGPLTTRVSLDATAARDGSVHLAGSVAGAPSGTVTVYREQPGAARRAVGQASVRSDGSFSLVDTAAVRPFLYRAVYGAPNGIPYAAAVAERGPDEEPPDDEELRLTRR